MKKLLTIFSLFLLINRVCGQEMHFKYDKLQRLSQINCFSSTIINYQYDALGNRLTYSIKAKLQSAELSVIPLKDTINAREGSLTIRIQNKGKGNMTWQAVSNNAWLSFAGDTTGTNNDSIVINYSSNTDPPRDGTVTITSTEATNSPQIVSIHQAGYTNHLWHIATTGSDVNGDGSESKPFATIQKGIDTAASGDTVLVNPGTYYENINISSKNLKIFSMWEFTADSSDIVNTIIDGNKKGRVFTLSNISSSAVFNGFTITNGLDTTKNSSGGAFNLTNSNPTLTNLIIKDNIAQYGGAISCYKSNPSLYNVKILNNSATHEGGGISCNQSEPVIKNSMINFNISSGNGGGLTLYDSSNARIINTLITNNKAATGGGAISIYDNSSPEFTNITLSGNSALQSPGIQSSRSTPTISNSIIWNKSYFDNAIITYSDIKGGWTGIGNIDSYPEFQDTTTYNYNLKCASPCLNSGNPDTTGLGTGSIDILGNPRISDNVIDMGAFEYQGTPIPGKAGIITGDTCAYKNTSNIDYSTLSITDATSYIWSLPKGATGKSTTNSISVSYGNNPQSGRIIVKGHNGCGNGYESSLKIEICTSTGVSLISSADGIKVYPNLVKDKIHIAISTPFTDNYKIVIYNNFGALVQTISKNKSDVDYNINLSTYPSGFYIVKIGDNKRVYIAKLFKE